MARPSRLHVAIAGAALLLVIGGAGLAVRRSASKTDEPAAAVSVPDDSTGGAPRARADKVPPAPRPLKLDYQRAAEILRAAEAIGLRPELGALAEADKYIGEGAREKFLRDRVSHEWELNESLEASAAELKESLVEMRSQGRSTKQIQIVQARIDELTTRARTHRILAAYLRLKLPAKQ